MWQHNIHFQAQSARPFSTPQREAFQMPFTFPNPSPSILSSSVQRLLNSADRKVLFWPQIEPPNQEPEVEPVGEHQGTYVYIYMYIQVILINFYSLFGRVYIYIYLYTYTDIHIGRLYNLWSVFLGDDLYGNCTFLSFCSSIDSFRGVGGYGCVNCTRLSTAYTCIYPTYAHTHNYIQILAL